MAGARGRTQRVSKGIVWGIAAATWLLAAPVGAGAVDAGAAPDLTPATPADLANPWVVVTVPEREAQEKSNFLNEVLLVLVTVGGGVASMVFASKRKANDPYYGDD